MFPLQQAKALHRAPSCCLNNRSRSHCVVAVGRMGIQLDTARTAQNSEVTVLIPTEQAHATPAVTQRQFGGASKAGVLVAAALAAGYVFNRLRKRGQEMGYNYYIPGRNDPFMSDVMKNVNTVQMDELSPEIIAAARARRSRERANHRLDLEEIELPDNHPFATKKPMSAEQEAAIKERLQVRPRQRGGPGQGGRGGDARARTMRQSLSQQD